MSYETIRIKREELYEQVWSQPLVDLTEQHGLSGVGNPELFFAMATTAPPTTTANTMISAIRTVGLMRVPYTASLTTCSQLLAVAW